MTLEFVEPGPLWLPLPGSMLMLVHCHLFSLLLFSVILGWVFGYTFPSGRCLSCT